MVSEEEFAALNQKFDQMVGELNESLQRIIHRLEALEALSGQNEEAHKSLVRTLGEVQHIFETQKLAINALFKALGA